MNTVKHWRQLNLQHLRKKPFLLWIKGIIPGLLFSSLIGTYLDLIMAGLQVYNFPIRPFPNIFSINIAFTLGVLPLATAAFLFLMEKLNNWGKAGLILISSAFLSILEKAAEFFAFFDHTNQWNHLYTFFGSCIFLGLLSLINRFVQT